MIVGYFLVKFGLIELIRNIEIIAWTTILFGILLFISDRFGLEKDIKKNFTYKTEYAVNTLYKLYTHRYTICNIFA